ncbi:MAG: tRNA pseudouridine(38-40) synthase TruA [bacterium]
MSTRRIAVRVEYDGTDHHGWQSQPTAVPTIQNALEAALAAVTGQPIRVDGASRTDAGVHALDQLAAFDLDHPIRPEGLVKAANRRLAPAIAIRDPRVVAPGFNPRFANRGKIYLYRLYTGRVPRPLIDRHAWRVPWPLDEAAMTAAAADLIGTHDFTSFAARDGTHHSAVRTLTRITFERDRHGVTELRVEGTAFLKHMVRNLVGTLVDIGRGHRPIAAMRTILAARDRSRAGPTAPGHGLCLERMLIDEAAFTGDGSGTGEAGET